MREFGESKVLEIPRTMKPSDDATNLAKLLRASLVEALSAANVGEGYPIKVSPRSPHQLESVIRLCCFNRVAWTLESALEIIGDGRARDVDVVVSLGFLIQSHKSDGELATVVHEEMGRGASNSGGRLVAMSNSKGVTFGRR